MPGCGDSYILERNVIIKAVVIITVTVQLDHFASTATLGSSTGRTLSFGGFATTSTGSFATSRIYKEENDST